MIKNLLIFCSIISLACGVQANRVANGEKPESNEQKIIESKNVNVEKSQSEVQTLNKNSETEKTMLEESNIRPISLRAKAEKADGKLIVEYEVENHTEQTLYLWDRMIDYTASGQIINQDIAYAFFEEPKTLRLVRANLPLPGDRDVARKEIPFVRGIPAKGKVQGKIVLPIPVNEYSPFYPPPTEENSKIEKCSEVRLLLGWSEFREGMQIREQTVGGEKVLAIRGSWQAPYHQLLERRIPIDVEVRVYTSVFDRKMPLR